MVEDHSDSEKGNPLPPHRLWCNIERENRICQLCNTGMGDEFHYSFKYLSLRGIVLVNINQTICM